jgi:hypothetical protein
MVKRQRMVLGMLGRVCTFCGGSDVVLVESRNVRRRQDLFNRHWHEHVRQYEKCNDCGTRSMLVDDGQLTPGAGMTASPSPAVEAG